MQLSLYLREDLGPEDRPAHSEDLMWTTFRIPPPPGMGVLSALQTPVRKTSQKD